MASLPSGTPPVRWGVAGQIVWAWILTIPATALDIKKRGSERPVRLDKNRINNGASIPPDTKVPAIIATSNRSHSRTHGLVVCHNRSGNSKLPIGIRPATMCQKSHATPAHCTAISASAKTNRTRRPPLDMLTTVAFLFCADLAQPAGRPRHNDFRCRWLTSGANRGLALMRPKPHNDWSSIPTTQ